MAGIGMFVYGKCFRVVYCRSHRDLVPVLPGKGEQMHALGWGGGCV